jgi:hypothetical protein
MMLLADCRLLADFWNFFTLQCPVPPPDMSVTVKGPKICKPNYIFNSLVKNLETC